MKLSCSTKWSHEKTQYINILDLGISGHGPTGPIRRHPRKKNLIYSAKEVKGRVSPLRLLIENCNNTVSLSRLTPRIDESFLVKCEGTEYKIPRESVRTLQRTLSLHYFGRLNNDENRKRGAPIPDISPSDPDPLPVSGPLMKRICHRLQRHHVPNRVRLADPYAKLPVFKPNI